MSSTRLPPKHGSVTLGMELKVWRDRKPDLLTAGLTQLDGYLAGLGLDADLELDPETHHAGVDYSGYA